MLFLERCELLNDLNGVLDLSPPFARRHGANGERMNRALHFLAQHVVHEAPAIKRIEPLESGGDDEQDEVAAAGGRAGMTGVFPRFVFDGDVDGIEVGGHPVFDDGFGGLGWGAHGSFEDTQRRQRSTREVTMAANESEYKGNPMIVLTQGPEDKFPFQFGLKKAKLILEHLDDIKQFIAKHNK